MKYKLINNQTKEEHLCDKVTIDGFDYYLSDENEITKDFQYVVRITTNRIYKVRIVDTLLGSEFIIIATNNPNIDIPKVVDEVEELANSEFGDSMVGKGFWISGYNKSQETHSNSDKDMIEFLKWVSNHAGKTVNKENTWHYHKTQQNVEYKTTEELLEIWKEQQPKIVYYE